jgi:hypothetical protein
MTTNSIKPVFTRYLYEFHHVKYSLQWALMEKKREEALYWAYELYHSGFQSEVWHWIRELYERYYEDHNPRFKTHLDRMHAEWKETADACLLGTVVGTLAIRDTTYLGKGERFIILYKEDRHQTKGVKGKARHYLKQVTQYPIRPQSKYMAQSFDGLALSKVREAYLGPNWLYYCAKTPIWESRIREGRGVVNDLGKRVAFGLDSELLCEAKSNSDARRFSGDISEAPRKEYRIENESDDDLEAFYERWGLEPDEQPLEMHHWHGIYPVENETVVYM